ncbi:MAG: DNA mismatch repair endonuclease MutL [Ruminococcaceae bacterium]|nr:DNA mismatch repair endonuclease MutL [Oscillospiraceae bacterium]
MPKINLLPLHISELIAAGEVVERPASVIKELVENSIDAGATRITVEIQRGGILYMRITDNGCGISFEDVPLAFMRHATSKISTDRDLDSIATLGFRGEALAATSSVSKIEMFTRTPNSDIGTHYLIEGGKETLYEESGCPEGTTIVVRDLFYNTPARMKFLKKDVSEGNAVASVIDRLAISHPEISFKLIRDGKQTLSTTGDGKLESAIYSVLGRDFSKSLIPVNSENSGVKVSGFICKPVFCRQSRAGQYTFLNSRLVHSGTVTAAVEQAYKNSAMVGKFPAFVINVEVPFDTVDVNVHPAKTEIRFADEKRIFDTVFYAVKNAINLGDTRPSIEIKPVNKAVLPNFNKQNAEYKQEKLPTVEIPVVKKEVETVTKSSRLNGSNIPPFYRENVENVSLTAPQVIFEKNNVDDSSFSNNKKYTVDIDIVVDDDSEVENVESVLEEELPEIRLIGEAFRTYIVVECENSIFMIDKHAAHERILFNKLKKEQTAETQQLLAPVTVRLSKLEHEALISNVELLEKSGFEVEDFGNSSIIVRAVPSTLLKEDVIAVINEVAEALLVKNNVEIEALDRLYHTVACKAAIKAGYHTTNIELLDLAKRVLFDKDVMYCPHGRPVAYELKKIDLEKQFGRIQ